MSINPLIYAYNKPEILDKKTPSNENKLISWYNSKINNESNNEPNNESLATSIGMAPLRIGKSLGETAINAVNHIPEYYEKGKSELSGLPQTVKEHPVHFTAQMLGGGTSDLLKGIFDTIHGAREYTANTLHLPTISTSLAFKIAGLKPTKRFEEALSSADNSKAISEGIEKLTDKAIGKPKYPGESLARGLVANIPGEIGAFNAVKSLATLPGKTVSKFMEHGNAAKTLEKQSSHLLNEAKRHEETLSPLTKKISEYLGKGAKTSEEIAPEIAKDVRTLHDTAEAKAGTHFKSVLDEAGKEKIYKKVDPIISMSLHDGKDLMSSIKDLKVGDLYKQFENNPTFEHAHKLQSELGVMIGEFKKIPGKTPDQLNQLGKIVKARETLKSDMLKHLEEKHDNKNLASKWKKGTEIYREEVEPFLSNKKLREINRGRKNYVKNIHEAFEYPEANDTISRTGEVKKGSGSKLFDMLPQETKDKILFSKIGIDSGEEPSKLLSAIKSAEEHGFYKYISPTLRENIANVINKQETSKLLKKQSIDLQPEIEELMKKQKSRNEKAKWIVKYVGIPTAGITGYNLLRTRPENSG